MSEKDKKQKIFRYAQLVLRAKRQLLSPEELEEQATLLRELELSHDEALTRAEAILTTSRKGDA